MEQFVAHGGRIIVDDASLKENEFGNPISVKFVTERLREVNPAALTSQITRNVASLPVKVQVRHEDGNLGLFFRMIPADNGSWLINLINYNPDAREISLLGDGEWYDLIREENFIPKFKLAPLKPLLLKFTPKN